MPGIEAARRALLVDKGFEDREASRLVFLKRLVEQGKVGDLRPTREFVLLSEPKQPSPITKPVPDPTPTGELKTIFAPTELARMKFFRELFKNRSPNLSARIIVNNVDGTIEAAETKLAASYPKEQSTSIATVDPEAPTPRKLFEKWLYEHERLEKSEERNGEFSVYEVTEEAIQQLIAVETAVEKKEPEKTSPPKNPTPREKFVRELYRNGYISNETTTRKVPNLSREQQARLDKITALIEWIDKTSEKKRIEAPVQKSTPTGLFTAAERARLDFYKNLYKNGKLNEGKITTNRKGLIRGFGGSITATSHMITIFEVTKPTTKAA